MGYFLRIHTLVGAVNAAQRFLNAVQSQLGIRVGAEKLIGQRDGAAGGNLDRLLAVGLTQSGRQALEGRARGICAERLGQGLAFDAHAGVRLVGLQVSDELVLSVLRVHSRWDAQADHRCGSTWNGVDGILNAEGVEARDGDGGAHDGEVIGCDAIGCPDHVYALEDAGIPGEGGDIGADALPCFLRGQAFDRHEALLVVQRGQQLDELQECVGGGTAVLARVHRLLDGLECDGHWRGAAQGGADGWGAEFIVAGIGDHKGICLEELGLVVE